MPILFEFYAARRLIKRSNTERVGRPWSIASLGQDASQEGVVEGTLFKSSNFSGQYQGKFLFFFNKMGIKYR